MRESPTIWRKSWDGQVSQFCLQLSAVHPAVQRGSSTEGGHVHHVQTPTSLGIKAALQCASSPHQQHHKNPSLQDPFAQMPWHQWPFSVRRRAFKASRTPPRRTRAPIEAVSRRDVIYGAAAAAILPLFSTAPAAAAETATRSLLRNVFPSGAFQCQCATLMCHTCAASMMSAARQQT